MKDKKSAIFWLIYIGAVVLGWVLFFVTKRSLVSKILLVVIGLGILVHVLIRNKQDKKAENEKEMKSIGSQTKIVEDDFDSFVSEQEQK